jgi:hypothetical protein
MNIHHPSADSTLSNEHGNSAKWATVHIKTDIWGMSSNLTAQHTYTQLIEGHRNGQEATLPPHET